MNQIPFREGQRFGQEEVEEVQLSARDMAQLFAEVPVWKQLIVWIFAGLIVVLVGLLLSPEMRKRMFVVFVRVAVTFWGVYFLFKNYGDQLFGFQLGSPSGAEEAGETTAPIPVFQPPDVSPAFSYLISFAFALLWLVLIWGLYRGWKKYQVLSTKKPLDEIARIARSSLNDLSSGRNSSDVIINCYLRMSDVVSDRRQLQRAAAMTPHEFAVRLEQAGLPGDAVTRLTRLFETVRYGDRKSGPRDVNEAVSCLKTILQYCGEPI